MNVLVDYDNVDAQERARGLLYLAQRIVDVVGAPHLTKGDTIRLRLYGGWYAGTRLTKRAQQISAEIAADFPTRRTFSKAGAAVSVALTAELAQSIEAEPQIVLPDTYRLRSAPENIRCASPPFNGCVNQAACDIASVFQLLDQGMCPRVGCPTTKQQIISRAEQKLVDSMLVVDLIYLASRATMPLVVVSTDDDLWPGIRMALLSKARVIHVHPVPGRITPHHYASHAGQNYTQRTF